jgi:copper transport protein
VPDPVSDPASRPRPPWPATLLALLLLALAPALLGAAPAQAHALLVSSNPPAGARLASTPDEITLVFDEPLVPHLSRATVVWPSGRRTEAAVSGEKMHARLAGNATGVYRVEWKTVSRIDGHIITGSFRFGVAVPVPGAATSAPVPEARDMTIAVFRTVEYVLLLLMCGIALVEHLGSDLRLRFPVRTVAAALLASGVLVVGSEIVAASGGLSAAGAATYLTNEVTGWARTVRLALEAGLVGVAVWRGRSSAVLLVGVCAAMALAGHGADVEPAWQGLAVNAGHLASAGIWAGGIMALALLRVRGEWPRVGSRLLPRFSRVAPWAFAASVLLGAVQAAQLLGGPAALVTTDYGLVLIAKAAVIAVMVPLSVLAWRRRKLSLGTEALLAVVVVAAAAALAAFPVVPKEAGEAAAVATPTAPPAFPAAGDLTLGGRAGSVMVGLTLSPGQPGANQARVYLANPATAAARAQVKVAGRWTAMTRCGAVCRTAPVRLRGHDTLLVRVSGAKGGTAQFSLPALPAQDGTGLVRAALARMDALSTYRVRENLSGIRSDYRYAVPHQMLVRTWWGAGPQDTLWRGRAVYRRSPPGPWKRRANGVLAPVPYFAWNPFRPLGNVRVIGQGRVGGHPVTLVSVFGGHGTDPEPVWFTLYVDATSGQVLESRMWAPNHFMKDRYYDFDRPVSIPDPTKR